MSASFVGRIAGEVSATAETVTTRIPARMDGLPWSG